MGVSVVCMCWHVERWFVLCVCALQSEHIGVGCVSGVSGRQGFLEPSNLSRVLIRGLQRCPTQGATKSVLGRNASGRGQG